MTKDEALELIRIVHYTYNQTLIRKDEIEIGKAWYPYLKDLELEETRLAFIDLSMESNYQPKPMDIRKATINARTKVPKPPLPNIAWATFQSLIKNANNGAHTPIEVHECLRKTLDSLGDTAYTMNDQYDKKRFEAVYEEAVLQYERNLYKV
jgi:hypothetical protein